MEHQKEHKIVVLGSASGDVFFKLDHVPAIGETIDAKGVEKAFGGKGGNQALTCGRLGAPIEMLVQLGDDDVGRGYIEYFKESNVGVTHAKLLKDVDSGAAYIMSLKNGDNSIIIVGGANAQYPNGLTELDPTWVKAI